jgi:hypothetical protein
MKVSNDVLEELRPDPVTMDPTWSHETLTRVMAGDSHSTRARTPRLGKRRVAMVSLAVVATSVAGVGVASANGLMPNSFTDAFSGWQHWPGHSADPATAERIATAPGPDGMVFSVLSTGHGHGDSCRTSVVESAESATHALPDAFTNIYGSFCSDAATAPTFGSTAVSNQDVAAGFTVSAGNAVRAEVRTPDGQAYPALLVEGDFWGWFPRTAHPTLVGFAADGSVVGTVRLW